MRYASGKGFDETPLAPRHINPETDLPRVLVRKTKKRFHAARARGSAPLPDQTLLDNAKSRAETLLSEYVREIGKLHGEIYEVVFVELEEEAETGTSDETDTADDEDAADTGDAE